MMRMASTTTVIVFRMAVSLLSPLFVSPVRSPRARSSVKYLSRNIQISKAPSLIAMRSQTTLNLNDIMRRIAEGMAAANGPMLPAYRRISFPFFRRLSAGDPVLPTPVSVHNYYYTPAARNVLTRISHQTSEKCARRASTRPALYDAGLAQG